MELCTVPLKEPYDILIGPGLLSCCGEHIRRISGAQRCLVVTDSNVAPLYGDAVCASLQGNGIQPRLFTFPAGEASKNLTTIAGIYQAMAEHKMTRSDLVVALGGGVTGDMAGFAAATFLRGVPFVQLPTTLLAQIDSSVGGKTGVDLPQGKNLVGAFWQPSLVLCDTDALDTLPGEFLSDGLAEAIKYGLIRKKELFALLSNGSFDENRAQVIRECVEIKAQVVAADERDTGERMILNFGHTLGHALEQHYHFGVLHHGQAVGVGMVMITKAAQRRGLSPLGTAEQIEAALRKYGLPVWDDTPLPQLMEALTLDKKCAGGFISLCLLKEVGNAYLHRVALHQLADFLG